MKSSERQSTDPRRVEEPPRPVPQQSGDAVRKAQATRPFVDPYDMRADVQPEEPGYGHGV